MQPWQLAGPQRPLFQHPHPYAQQHVSQRMPQPLVVPAMQNGSHWAPVNQRPHVQELVIPHAQQPIQQSLNNVQLLNNPAFSQHGTGQVRRGNVNSVAQGTQQPSQQNKPNQDSKFAQLQRERRANRARAEQQDQRSGRAIDRNEKSQAGPLQHSNLQTPQQGHVDRSRSVISRSQKQNTLQEPKPRLRQARIYVRNGSESHARVEWCPYPQPHEIVQQLPTILTPANPVLTQTVLRLMKPSIVYAEYENRDCSAHGCRSRGICLHFSFVLGGRDASDGLICPVCQKAGVEQPVVTPRLCPMHNPPKKTQFTSNLSEDILATEVQRKVATEILTRSWNCKWEGVESNVKTELVDDTVKVLHGSAQPVQGASQPGGIRKAIASIEIEDSDSDRSLKRTRTGDQNHTDANDKSTGAGKTIGERSNNVEGNIGSEGNSNNLPAPSGLAQSGDSTTVEKTAWWEDSNAGVDGNLLFEDHLMSWPPEPESIG